MTDLLQIKNIRKTFPGVVALDDISLSIAPGEIHTLLGENGAGKSTLMNVLTGLYRPDRGELCFDGVDHGLRRMLLPLKNGNDGHVLRFKSTDEILITPLGATVEQSQECFALAIVSRM